MALHKMLRKHNIKQNVHRHISWPEQLINQDSESNDSTDAGHDLFDMNFSTFLFLLPPSCSLILFLNFTKNSSSIEIQNQTKNSK